MSSQSAKSIPPPFINDQAKQSSAFDSANDSNNLMVNTLRESLRLNAMVISQLRDHLLVSTDQHHAGSMQTQIDALLSQQRALAESIADATTAVTTAELSGTERPSKQRSAEHSLQQPHNTATPMLKRHILKVGIGELIVFEINTN